MVELHHVGSCRIVLTREAARALATSLLLTAGGYEPGALSYAWDVDEQTVCRSCAEKAIHPEHIELARGVVKGRTECEKCGVKLQTCNPSTAT